MSAKGHQSRMTIDIPIKDHKHLKALAAVLGKSMRELVVEWIRENLYREIPLCLETPSQGAENGKDLIQAGNTQDLFRRLGI